MFDPQSRQLILRNRNRGIDSRAASESSCPRCGRPYDQTSSSAVHDDFAEEQQQPSFINADYFRLLARSLPGSTQTSAPPSPRRQLAQPVRKRAQLAEYERFRPTAPPPGAEFVGSTPAPPAATRISETAFAPAYFEKFFVIEKELGRGGRGVVLLVKHVLDNVTLGSFACKRVPVGDDHAWLEKVLVEVQALQSLSHQNLVSYRHVWLQDYQVNNFGPGVPCAFILQQYCNGGDLQTYVIAPAQVQTTTQQLKERIRRRSRGEAEIPHEALNEPRKLPFDDIYSFFRDITEGLRFLHLNGFIHRDLKPSNCLLHTVSGETRVLVSDFGEVQYANTVRKSTGATGTISYCAPEVLKPVSPGGPLGNFTFKSDIFSLGMILHFLCFAGLPYHTANILHEELENVDDLREEITSWSGFDDRRQKRPDLPGKLYSFLKELLSLQPETRPSSDDVLNGIKFGGLDAIPEFKRRSSAGPEEIAPVKRITKIDSPTIGPVNKPLRDLDAMSPSRQMRKRVARSSSLSKQGGEHESPKLSSDEQEKVNPSAGALMMRRSSSHGIPHPVGLGLRNASASASLPPQQSPKAMSPSPEMKQQQHQLLLPPPQPRMQSKIISAISWRPPLSFQIIVFATKVMSVLQPCLSHGINNVVFYVTFGLAALELASFPHQVWRIFLLAAIHVCILWYAHKNAAWCRSGWDIDP